MFCKYCGKSLQEGEICTCQQSQQQPPPMDDAQQQQQGQPYQENYNQGQQQQYNNNYQQQGQPQYQQYSSNIPPSATAPINGVAIAGFVVSLVSIFLNPIMIVGIVAIILSAVASSQIKATGAGGQGFATAGLVIGIIITVIYAIVYATCATALTTLGLSSFY